MNADLTINSIAFKKSFDEKGGSERSASARGVNFPDVMVIKHQDTTEGAKGGAAKRHLMRFDYQHLGVDGVNTETTSAYVVFVHPKNGTQAALDSVLATLRAAVGDTTNDYLESLLNNES